MLKNTPLAPFLLGLQKPFSVAMLHPLQLGRVADTVFRRCLSRALSEF